MNIIAYVSMDLQQNLEYLAEQYSIIVRYFEECDWVVRLDTIPDGTGLHMLTFHQLISHLKSLKNETRQVRLQLRNEDFSRFWDLSNLLALNIVKAKSYASKIFTHEVVTEIFDNYDEKIIVV